MGVGVLSIVNRVRSAMGMNDTPSDKPANSPTRDFVHMSWGNSLRDRIAAKS